MYFSISSSRPEDVNHEGGPCRQPLTTRNFHLHPKHHPASWPLGSQPWVVCCSRAVWMVALNCGRQYALSLAEEWWWWFGTGVGDWCVVTGLGLRPAAAAAAQF